GVLYFYLLLPVAILFSFSPYYLTSFFAFISLLSVLIVYLVAMELFDEKTGIIAALLFGSSYRINIFARAIWTPSLIPFFVLTLLYILVLIKKKQKISLWPVFAFLLSAMTQIHNSGYFYAFMFLVIIFIVRPHFPKNIWQRILIAVSFIIPILPTISYEVITGFKLVPSVLSALFFQYNLSQHTSTYELFLQPFKIVV